MAALPLHRPASFAFQALEWSYPSEVPNVAQIASSHDFGNPAIPSTFHLTPTTLACTRVRAHRDLV